MTTSTPRLHTFYIPVMGTGFTIDTPLKVAPYGISSTISLVDDVLIEKIREYYCGLFKEKFVPVPSSEPDCRARRITMYLDFLNRHVKKKFEALRSADFERGSEIHKYFSMLPDHSRIKKLYLKMTSLADNPEKKRLQDELRDAMQTGSIDVNIMTKLDTPARTDEGPALLDEYSSAMAALRGFAQSTLNSAVVFSAGVNQRLYTYTSEFKDFYSDSVGQMKKKIVLKVKNFRSAMTQGKLFAKKGLWVSAFRVESGLNCGGHAFGGQGSLLGPVLEEFKNKREVLVETLKGVYEKAVKARGFVHPAKQPEIEVHVQGGIGTAAEDDFLRKFYRVEDTGWATPFLFCPEATNVDEDTLQHLMRAQQEDIVLSGTSPLGIPFHILRTGSAERAKNRRKEVGEKGLPCVKGYLRLNQEFGRPLCPASKTYQEMKVKAVEESDMSPEDRRRVLDGLAEKDCICHQLGNGVMKKYGLPITGSAEVAVCPGPNGVFFTRTVSLQEMADHIYGRGSVLEDPRRPHMFVNELLLNVEYLKAAHCCSCQNGTADRDKESLRRILDNLFEGVAYYRRLLETNPWDPAIPADVIKAQLDDIEASLRAVEGDLGFADSQPGGASGGCGRR